MKNNIVYISTVLILLFSFGCTKELANEEILFFDYSLTTTTPLRQDIIINETANVTFTLQETRGTSKYIMTYVSSGEGVLTYGENTYMAGEAIEIESGEIELSYTASTEGEQKVTFTVKNNNTTPITKEVELTFNYVEKELFLTCLSPNPIDGYIPIEVRVAEDSETICNLMDSDINTHWSADGEGTWVQFDLEEIKSVNQIQIAFGMADTRTYKFNIQVSDDAITWRDVIIDRESSAFEGLQSFNFDREDIQYIRYIGFGNQVDTNNALLEVVLDNKTTVVEEDLCIDPLPDAGIVPVEIVVSSSVSTTPCNIMDNRITESSRWSSQGDNQWVYFDLGAKKDVSQVQIAFHRGNERIYTFSIQVSNDATNWSTILDKEVSKKSGLDFETFSFPVQNARYIRYLGFTNDINDFNSLAEFRIQ